MKNLLNTQQCRIVDLNKHDFHFNSSSWLNQLQIQLIKILPSLILDVPQHTDRKKSLHGKR